ncbi:MAG: alpha/beta hydrolase [Bacteroidetes bacterium]|nr:alpha/beta hydrolase [Bacteroidota bacterium]
MLHYEISGNGNENLVLLHGFLENSKIWVEMEKTLSPKFKLIKIDLPGHGKSPKIATVQSMELMAEEVLNTLEHLEITKFHLLGHSMGGYISLAFAELFPQYLKSMTLFFSTYFADSQEKKEQRKKSYRIIEDAFGHYVNAGIPNYFNSYEIGEMETTIHLAKSIGLETDNLGALACAKGMVERKDRTHVLEQFEEKILIIAGKHDNAVDTVAMIKNLPERSNIKSYILDCGHSGHWERPTICAEIINIELLKHLPKKLVL